MRYLHFDVMIPVDGTITRDEVREWLHDALHAEFAEYELRDADRPIGFAGARDVQ